MTGRPLPFNTATADAICERIAGGESLRTICKDRDMPSPATVFKWLNNQPTFAEQYARAREAQADTIVDEIVDIADRAKDPNKARVQIDARKWVAGKMKPKKYGEKVLSEVSGPDGTPIAVVASITRTIVDPKP